MTRAAKLVLAFVIVGGAGFALRPWIERQLGSGARAAYFERGRSYAPRLLQEVAPLPPELREASGIAVSRTQPGVLWAHNDSGDAAVLYAIDQRGTLLAKVTVADTTAIDWEDMAAGPCPDGDATSHCLYVADTGNNNRSRDILTIYVLDEPFITEASPAQPIRVTARSFRFRYPSEPDDAEALAILPTGDVTLVTKGRAPTISFFGFTKADVARAVATGEILTARLEGDTAIAPDQGLGRWVTAAAISPDGTTLAVRTYSEIFFYAVERTADGIRWRNLEKPCFLGDLEPQGEAIDYLDEHTLIIGSETSQGRQGVMHRVRCE